MILPTVITVILAAGNSSRLGTHKALIQLGKKTAITKVIETSLASISNKTVVILGAEAASIANQIQEFPIELVENTQYFLGRTGSIKCALRYLAYYLNDKKTTILPSVNSDTIPTILTNEANADFSQELKALSNIAILIFPVDCPFVPNFVLNKLISCLFSNFNTTSKSLWITPEHKGKRGHPVLLFGPVLSKVFELSNDFPLRNYLHITEGTGALHHLTVPVDTESVLDNINTPEDLQYLLKREELT